MSMTREEKIQRIEALREKRRRLLKEKPPYTPNEGQLRVHLDERPIRIVTSGNGSGKTTVAVQEAWWAAAGWNPILKKKTKVPAKIIVLLDAPKKVNDIFLKELRNWYPVDSECELKREGKPLISTIAFKNGSEITFMFHEQSELAFEGIELTDLLADEPMPRHCWVGLTRGMRKKGTDPKVLIIGTPIGQPWIYQELYKPAEDGLRPDIGIHNYSTKVNEKNLAKDYIEQFSKNLTKKEKETRLDGRWSHLEGLALAHLWDRECHIVEPFRWPVDKPVVVAVDPHPAKNHVAIMLGAMGDGRLYYIKELSSKAPPTQFARELKSWYEGYRVIDIVCDSLGETPGTGGDGNMSFSEKLRSLGVRVRSTSFQDKLDSEFIEKIRQVMEIPEVKDNFGRQVPKLAVFSGNSGIISDIETVSWQKVRHTAEFRDKMDISAKDYLACLKYALTTEIIFQADKLKRPQIQRHKKSPWSAKRTSNVRRW